MTPHEVSISRSLASALLADTVLNVAMLVLYGPLIILFLCSVYIYRNSTIKRGLIVISILCFILATLETIVCLGFQVVTTASLYIETGAGPLIERSGTAEAALLPCGLLMTAAYQILLLLNDGVMVWRACVLHCRRIKVVIPLTMLLGMDTAATLWFITEWGLWASDTRQQAQNTGRLGVAFPLVQTLSIVVNLYSTFLIGYMLRQHRSRLALLKWRKSQPHRILLLLVESGIFLCLSQIVILILSSLKGFSTPIGYQGNAMGDTSNIIVMILYIYLAMYPNIVILLARFPSYSFTENHAIPTTQSVY